MKKILLLSAAAVGYVLGARAGRERYEQIKSGAQKVAENPKVQAATSKAQETVTAQASAVAGAAKEKVSGGSGTATSTATSTGTTAGMPAGTTAGTPTVASPTAAPTTTPDPEVFIQPAP